MATQKLKEFLDAHGIPYVSLPHAEAYTAQEVAASAHISGREMAKTVVVKIDGKFALAVLPAHQKVVLHDLREITGTDQVTFASEDEFKSLFPDCEVGAMPPFGNLYGLDTFVSPGLEANHEFAFNAGTHSEVIKMAYADFKRLVNPTVASFTT